MSRLRCFPPVIDAKTRVVILGSFPSIMSLQQRQYYGNPQNQFWRLVGECIREPLADLSYEKRVQRLLSHNIGLWDVHESCEREGSVDGNIRGARDNNLSKLEEIAPNIRFCCNGAHAAAAAKKQLGEAIIILPSSSRANTMPYKTKLAMWKKTLRSRNTGILHKEKNS
jgi:hypoxanthine-DNA glycosylase